MSATSSTAAALKRTPVIVTIAIAAVVLLVWLFAYFLPQGHKLSTLDAKQSTLQREVTTGNAKVARLKHTFEHSAQLEAQLAKMEAYVPSTPDLFKTTANYTSSLSSAVAAAGMSLKSVTPGVAVSGQGKSSITTIPVSLEVTGSYDHLLSLITDIYSMARLTEIDGVAVRGGGLGTNRTTALQATLSLVVFTTAKPPAATP